MFFKKLPFAALYMLVFYFVDRSMVFLGFVPDYGGNGISYFSILVLSIIICSLSYNLRIIKIKKQNKGMESEEYAVFNDTAKAKISFIVKSADFKIEAIMYIIISVVFTAKTFIETAIANGIESIFANPINILLLFVGIAILPLYMAALDVFVWFKALNKCYKKKAY